ncbi:MAG: DNRLRE domain-containing protein, partial [Thermoanaerobaculales bacterium]|nr:DNRLRE domain-containing protein [Thermoanaerobaculales bacterium]
MQHDPGIRKSPTVPQRQLAWSAWGVALLVTLLAAQVHAHVFLDRPNGGEMLEVGSVVQIVWGDEISHGPADYDLWYSTTGPDGPWITIVRDLPPSGTDTTSYDWVVPDTPSSQVRVRVQQDNADVDYLAISESDLAIVSDAAVVPVVLDAEKDATIHEEGNGTDANGSGSYLFTGRTAAQGGSAERRALLAFSIAASIPEGSTISSVSLELMMSKTTSGAQTVGLHRLLEDWSEGPANPSGQEGGGATGAAG